MRPRHPNRQRPNNKIARVTHVKHDNTILRERLCVQIFSTRKNPLNKASDSTAKPEPSAANIPDSRDSIGGKIDSQPKGWRLRKRPSSKAKMIAKAVPT